MMLKNNPGRSEEEILQFRSFKEGSEPAYRYFFDLHNRPLYLYARNMVRNDAVAEDIIQDSLIVLDRNRDKINDAEHLKNFLYTVTRNNVLAYLLDLKQQQKTERSWASYQYEWAYQHNDVEMIRDRTLGLIYEHIDQLPPRRKEVFLMSFTERLNVKAIATRLEISESTVYNHLYEAYQYFTKMIPPELLLLLLLAGGWLL